MLHDSKKVVDAKFPRLLGETHATESGVFHMNVFNLRTSERVSVFIDGPNMYAAVRELQQDVDFARLRRVLQESCHLNRIHYYTAVTEERDTPFSKMLDWLDYNGYMVHTKPAKVHFDAEGRRRVKGNMDVDIAVDMMETSNNYDHAILFSGDGDFRPLVESLQRKGVKVTVVSTMETATSMIADELRRQADQFIDLGKIMPQICRVKPQ